MFSTWYGIWRFKDLKRRAASDKILIDKAFNIAKNPKYDRYRRGLAPMVYKFFGKNSASLTDKSGSGGGVSMPLELLYHNEQLAKELHKPIIRKLE